MYHELVSFRSDENQSISLFEKCSQKTRVFILLWFGVHESSSTHVLALVTPYNVMNAKSITQPHRHHHANERFLSQKRSLSQLRAQMDPFNNQQSKKNTTQNDKINALSNVREFFTIPDRDLLAGDLLALILVAQLFGFTDAILDPDFIPNGGFNAPIPVIPATLSTLVARLSVMDIAWVLASLKSRGYNPEAVADDLSALKCGLTIWLDHCSLRIILAIVLAIFSHSSVEGMDLLRQMWFTLPIMLGFRVIYCRSRTGRL